MIDQSQIREHMEVVGSDGQHVGTVDKLDGMRIKMTKEDPAAQGEHHFLPFSAIESVQDGKLHLNLSAAEAMAQQKTEGTGAPGSIWSGVAR